MKAVIKHSAIITAAATLCAGFAMPAKADLIFRMHNASGYHAKGSVLDLQTIMLRPGQITPIQHAGSWTAGNCAEGSCPAQLRPGYTVYFQHPHNAGILYCVWKVTHRIKEATGSGPGHIGIDAALIFKQPGFGCEARGQVTVPYHPSSQGETATLDFRLRDQ